MDIRTLELPPLGTNCYIMRTGEGEAVVIDPADEAAEIMAAAGEMGCTIKKILLTHGHFDHTGAAMQIKQETGAPIFIHEADECMLSDGVKALAFFCPGKPFITCEADTLLKDGDEIKQGSVTFRVMHTPGHSGGSVCFLCEDSDGRKIMFAGDTIFKDSVGRSDCWSGDYMVQQESLDKLRELTDDYIIYPGHGPATTLETEKRFNPFLADF